MFTLLRCGKIDIELSLAFILSGVIFPVLTTIVADVDDDFSCRIWENT